MTTIAILDYGMGNLRSVEKALEHVGSQAVITAEPERARGADGLILPGVGAFPAAMRRVHELGLDALVSERLQAGTPVLGICLGLQLLFSSSSENEGAEGLGLIAGDVSGLRAPGLKVPHMGWSPVRWERDSDRPSAAGDVLGTAEYGERFACAIDRPPLYGVQFHPEKSSAAGLRLLSNFAEICARVVSAA